MIENRKKRTKHQFGQSHIYGHVTWAWHVTLIIYLPTNTDILSLENSSGDLASASVTSHITKLLSYRRAIFSRPDSRTRD